jgi:hypothetical protein
MEKPTKHKRKEVMDYHEMIKFINEKYSIDTRNYKGHDYWHWMLDNGFYEVSNGGTDIFELKDILDDEDGDKPEWVLEITKLIYDEFIDELDEDGSVEVLLSW